MYLHAYGKSDSNLQPIQLLFPFAIKIHLYLAKSPICDQHSPLIKNKRVSNRRFAETFAK